MSSENHSPRTLLRRTATALVTLGFVAGSAGLVVGGRAVLADRAEAAVPAPQTRAPAVRTVTLRLDSGHDVTRRFAGQVEPAQLGAFGFELGGTLATVLVDEGDTVVPGQVVATLDRRLIEAEQARLLASRRAAQAQAELARRTETRQRELNERGHASDQVLDDVALALAQAQARMAEVDAALVAVAVQLEKTELRASFPGIVSTRHADPGATLGAGQPVISVQQSGPRRFRVGIAPELADRLGSDTPLVLRIDGQEMPARLSALLPGLDPATRTRTVLLDLADGATPPFGAVGEVVLRDTVAAVGAWLPVSALLDGPRGTWLVRTVGPDGVIASEAVEILHAETERVYVRGTLRDGAQVVATGPHRVVPGQVVSVQTAAAGGL